MKEELNGISVVAKFAITATDGKTYSVEHYNIEMITSIGYRVKSVRGVQFRQWANKILKEYLLRDRHNKQYAPIAVETSTHIHDRFLIIDDTLYHIGASIKDLGKKLFAFSKMEFAPDLILDRL